MGSRCNESKIIISFFVKLGKKTFVKNSGISLHLLQSGKFIILEHPVIIIMIQCIYEINSVRTVRKIALLSYLAVTVSKYVKKFVKEYKKETQF